MQAFRAALLLPALLAAQPDAWEREAEQALKSGDYARAIERATAAADAFRAAGQKDQLGGAINTIGAAYARQGKYADALVRMEESLALARETGDAQSEVSRLNNAGGVYSLLGDYGKAYARCEAALGRVRESAGAPWHARGLQLTLGNLAVLRMQLGQYPEALDLYREIRTRPSGLEPNIEAQVLTNLAVVQRRLGDPRKALATYAEARNLLARDPNAAASLFVLHNAGVVQALDLRDHNGAMRTFREALAIATAAGSRHDMVTERLFLGETLLRMGRPAEAKREFDQALAGAAALTLAEEQAKARYGLGRVLASSGDREGALAQHRKAIDLIESTRARIGLPTLAEEFLATRHDVYDAAIEILITGADPPPAEVFRLMELSRGRSLNPRLAQGGPATIGEVRARLGESTALAEYWVRGGRYAAVWMTRDGQGIVTGAWPAVQVEAFTAALRDPRAAHWTSLARPLRALTEDCPAFRSPRVVVVPDDEMAALPFEALDSPSVITYLPAARLLRGHAPASGRRWPWRTSLVAFADPLPSAASDPLGQVWRRLPHSDGEARAAAAALPGTSRVHSGADNLASHVTAEARQSPPVWHFATHAVVDASDERRSRLIFSAAAGDPGSTSLYASSIGGLDLTGAELVTLAACETAQGRITPGEGIHSFSRTFLAAGAEATVSSLWRVPDRETARLMERFYRHLGAGQDKASALRQAKLDMTHAGGVGAHPYYWAAFVLHGDGSRPLTPVIPWAYLTAPPLAAAAAAYLARRRKHLHASR